MPRFDSKRNSAHLSVLPHSAKNFLKDNLKEKPVKQFNFILKHTAYYHMRNVLLLIAGPHMLPDF